ncbi:MAG: amidohydrolase family protein [Planctomycetota bacterium]|nr:amidohydrolase family protein [Planctomycetota bacterium]
MLFHLAAAGLALAASGPAHSPPPVLITNVRLSAALDAKAASILVRAGRIERIEEGTVDAPVDARTIDGKAALVLPAFLDAYTFGGCATPEPKAERDQPAKTSTDVLVDMREANRRGIQPAFRAADVFEGGEALEAWRASGFGALLSAPSGQLLAGQSALVATRAAAARDAIVRPSVFDHASFRSSGSGYPSTLMGSIAQLRQFFLDARHQGEILARRAQGKIGERPPFDADLQAAQECLAKRRVVCCAVDEADDIERFLALADQHGFSIAIAGGREAWKRARLLAERGIPVILTPEGGDEPEDPDAKDAKKAKEPQPEDVPWTYVEPVGAKRDKHQQWAEQRDGARVLAEAGVRIAFGTGKDKPKDLVERVRKLVAAGLPRETALRALTEGSAEILGAAPALGRLAAGSDGTFALWTKDPLTDKDAAVTWLFVDGRPHEFEVKAKSSGGKDGPDDGVDATGTWSIAYDVPQVPSGELEIKMEKDGSVEGTLRGKSPGGAAVEAAVSGRVRGKTLQVSGTLAVEDMRMLLELEGDLDGDTWKGTLSGVMPVEIGFTAQRTPKDGGR